MAEAVNPIDKTKEDAQFINKLYDDSLSQQKQTLSDNLTQNTGALDTQAQNVQQQTQTHQQRTDVESQKGAQNLNTSGLSQGGQSQAGLTLGNQLQKDTSALQDQKAQADAEIERQRQILASQYEAAIKEAQANNDMQRAQQLYEAAKREEERLRGYRQDAGNALAAKGDYSIVENLYGLSDSQSQAIQDMYNASSQEGYTTPDSLKADEEALKKIYDASYEAQAQKLQSQYEQDRSDLQAKQAAQQRSTDEALTKTYVDSLRQGKNYNEVQNAYGLGSGTKAQASLAREAGLQDDLTALRKLQLGYDAKYGMSDAELLKNLLASRQTARETADKGFNESLNDAYTDARDQQLADQEAAGKLLAKDKNDYSILGKLWGLTQDQIDRLQGTGAYAPQEVYYGGTPSSTNGSLAKPTLPKYEQTYLGQGSNWLGQGSDYQSPDAIGFADVVDGAMKTAQKGGNVDDYITAAREGGYITSDQAKDLKINIKNLA